MGPVSPSLLLVGDYVRVGVTTGTLVDLTVGPTFAALVIERPNGRVVHHVRSATTPVTVIHHYPEED